MDAGHRCAGRFQSASLTPSEMEALGKSIAVSDGVHGRELWPQWHKTLSDRVIDVRSVANAIFYPQPKVNNRTRGNVPS